MMMNSIFFIMHKKSSQKPTLHSKMTHVEIQDVSQQHSKTEKIGEDEQVLPLAVEEELQLNLEKYSHEIKEEIRYILIDLLKYPSSSHAQRHRYSNRLGNFDLRQVVNKQNNATQFHTSVHQPEKCEDCGLIVQEKEIPICASLWEFPKVGPATFYLFDDIKHLAWMVFLLGVVFSIFALYTSIVEPTESFSAATFPRKVSYIPKMLYASSNTVLTVLLGVQAWLIVVSALIWWILQFTSQCFRLKYERIMEEESLSASDFTIMLDNVPSYFTKERLQNEFNRYFQSLVYHNNLKKTWGDELRPFQIDRVSQVLPFGLSQKEVLDQELQGLDQDILQKRRLLTDWMVEFKENARFTFKKSDRKRQYEIIQKMLQRRRNKLQQMQQKAQEQYRLPLSKDLKTIFFVTFKCNQSVRIIENINPQSIPAKIRYFLSCCRSAQYFSVRDDYSNEQVSIYTRRAPDPEDIIWGQLKTPVKTLVVSRLITWSAIVGIIGATFGICYGLNYLAISSGLTFMPVILAIVITISNVFLKFTIRKLSAFQSDETESDRQRGILIKCLIALPFNWIFTPIIISIVVNLNLYDSNGIVYFIFFIAIANAIIPPFLRIIDMQYFFRQLRALWKNRPYKKMQLRQGELNAILENEEYQLGYCYAYFIEVYFLTCFYAPMIPGITASSLVSMFLMYWAEKYVLLNRSKRPPVHANALTMAAHTSMLLGPLILGFGGFLWVCILRVDFSSIAFIAYMVLLGFGALYFITPFRAIFQCLFAVPDQEILLYEDCRSKLPSEYDRLNPVTSEKGMAEYYQFLQKRKEQDRATALNRSQGNLLQQFDINLMIDGMTKIPNIFGKNTDISKKLDHEDYSKSRVLKKKPEDIVFVTPPNIKAQETLYKEIQEEQFEEKVEKLSRAETEQKPVMNYNSSGNAYCRKKKHNDRKTVSVLENGAMDYDAETRSHQR